MLVSFWRIIGYFLTYASQRPPCMLTGGRCWFILTVIVPFLGVLDLPKILSIMMLQ